ncbi:MAG: hypothetical protein IJ228_07645 [Succinivibrio sp.]|nr:hypothetical protein [Succinivibrio sp.]
MFFRSASPLCLLTGAALWAHALTATAAPLEFKRLLDTQNHSNDSVCAVMSAAMEGSTALTDLTGYISLKLKDGSEAKVNPVLEGNRLCLTALTPGTAYTLTFKKGLKAANGDALAADVVQKFVTSDAPPALSLEHGIVLPREKEEPYLLLKSVNVPAVKVQLYRISPSDLNGSEVYSMLQDTLHGWQLSRLLSGHAAFLGSTDYNIGAQSNTQAVTKITLSELESGDHQGMYLVLVGQPDLNFDDPEVFYSQDKLWLAKLLLFSDIGITTYEGTNGIDVAVRSLRTAEPYSGVRVQLVAANNEVLTTVRTGRYGYAHFSRDATSGRSGLKPSLVVAQGEKDWAALSLEQTRLYLKDNQGRQRSDLSHEVFSYTDRGIYRPGEKIHFVSLVRNGDLSRSDLKAVRLRIIRPNGTEFKSVTLTDEGGSAFAYDFTLPEHAPMGNWLLELGLDRQTLLSSTYVQVQDFIPTSYTISAPESLAPLKTQVEIPLTLSAQFNYGEPGAWLMANAHLTVRPDEHPVASLGDFYFGPESAEYEKLIKYTYLDEQKTDEKGIATFHTVLPEAPYARQVLFEGTVYGSDGGNQSVSRVYKVESHTPLIGVRKLPGAGNASFEVVMVDQDGHAQEGDITYTIHRRQVSYQYAFINNNWRYMANEHRTLVDSGALKALPSGEAAKIELPLDNGSYVIALKSGHSATAYEFYQGYMLSDLASSPDRFDLSTDKKSYRLGESVTLEFDSVAEGYADLAVGTDKIVELTRHRVQQGHNSISFETTEAMGLGAHAIVTVYTPVNQAGAGSVRAVGLAYVALDNSAKVLDVKLGGSSEFKPFHAVDVPLEITGGQGTVYYTAALVDNGILSLTGFKPPRPDVELLEPPRMSMEIADLYGYLIKRLPEEGQGYGADSDEAGNITPETMASLRRRNVSIFHGIASLKDGKTQLHFFMPRHQGSVKLMVTAWNDTALGSATRDIVIRDLAVAQLATPRYLNTGDKLNAVLSLHNLKAQSGTFQLSVSCEGTLKCGQEQELKVPQGQRVNVDIPLSCEEIGSGKLNYALRAPDYHWQDSVELQTTKPWSRSLTNTLIHLKPGEHKTTKPLEGFEEGAVVTLELGPLPFVNTQSYLEALRGSRSLDFSDNVATAAALMRAMENPAVKKGFGAGDLPEAQVAAEIQNKLDFIASRSNTDGTFRVFQDSFDSDEYLNVLAGAVMLQARQQGYDISQSLVSTIISHLKYCSDNDDDTVSAQAMEVLSSVGEHNLAALRYKFDQGKVRAPLALASFARAFHRYGDEERSKQALKRGGESMEAVEGIIERLIAAKNRELRLNLLKELQRYESVSQSSPVLDDCALLYSCIFCGQQEEAEQIIRRLTARGRLNGSLSPQVMATLLAAQAELGTERTTQIVEPKFNEKGELTVKNDSASPVYATLSVNGYTKERPANAAKYGVSVKQRLFSREGTEILHTNNLKLNEELIIFIEVNRSALTRSPLQLMVPLPAGFEFEHFISPADPNYNFFEALSMPMHYTHRDRGLTFVIEPSYSTQLRLAFMVRPAFRGQMAAPVISAVAQSEPAEAATFSPKELSCEVK